MCADEDALLSMDDMSMLMVGYYEGGKLVKQRQLVKLFLVRLSKSCLMVPGGNFDFVGQMHQLASVGKAKRNQLRHPISTTVFRSRRPFVAVFAECVCSSVP